MIAAAVGIAHIDHDLPLPIRRHRSTISMRHRTCSRGIAAVFMEPAETSFDLRWRMFNIPVRVHPLFWIVGAALGWERSYVRFGINALLVWMFAMFVSILIHELGHVFMGRVFGTDGHIVLHGFGGLAIGSNNLYNPWKRIAVSFAGPGAQLVLLALVWFFASRQPQNPIVGWLLDDLFLINL